jgi:N-methylhydantoinase B
MNVRTLNRQGKTVMASIGPVGGGAGGRSDGDGAEGAGANSSFLKNTPIEINEAEVPIRFSRYGLWADTAGAGKWRGGSGTVMEFQVFSPQTMITARNRDRSIFSAWGLNGGYAGKTSSFVVNPDTPKEIVLNNKDIVHCEANDIIRIIGPGAGGWGDPLERSIEALQADLDGGFVSVASAEQFYGVAFVDGKIDVKATEQQRMAKKVQRPLFDYGPALTAFKKIWNDNKYAALTTLLLETSIPWRHWVKTTVFGSVEKGEYNNKPDKEQIVSIYNQLVKRFPEMRIANIN